MMAIMLIILVILIASFVIGGFIVFKKIKETDPNNSDNTIKRTIETTQEFLPFEDIKDNMIDLGQHQYRAIIKCDSLNYSLKSDKEQNLIEFSYQSFVNSLSHPVQIYIATKIMDNTNMLNLLKVDIEESIENFPILAEYGEIFYGDMENIYTEIGNNKEKNKYIVVPFNEGIALTNSTDEEKYEYSYKELQNRCQIIMEGLKSSGVNCNLLNTKELIELLYTAYHKDNANQSKNIVNGEFLKMSVSGKEIKELTHEETLDWILYVAQSRLKDEILNNRTSDENIKERTSKAIDGLSNIRDNVAGKYKEDFNIDSKINFFE